MYSDRVFVIYKIYKIYSLYIVYSSSFVYFIYVIYLYIPQIFVFIFCIFCMNFDRELKRHAAELYDPLYKHFCEDLNTNTIKQTCRISSSPPSCSCGAATRKVFVKVFVKVTVNVFGKRVRNIQNIQNVIYKFKDI